MKLVILYVQQVYKAPQLLVKL